ncbi:MAG: ATP-binding cassette domain-containing protein [Sphingomonadaceae bacterium]
MKKAIEVRDLSKSYPKPMSFREILRHRRWRSKTDALRGVGFHVAEGEVFGLLGPNGAGKTTLIKILCTLVLPTEGSASVNGFDVVRDPAAVRRSIGYVVADERSFYWRLTGRQNLRFFATLNNLIGKEGERRVEEVADLVGLREELDTPFLHYSTGTKQKMAIARGMLTDPPILLLDEPTRSLDLPTARAVRGFVKSGLAAQGRTVLIATHNMEEASELCQRVAVIDRGRLRAWGTPAEIAQAVDWTGKKVLLEVDGWTEGVATRVRLLPGVRELALLPRSCGENGRALRLRIGLREGADSVAEVIETVVRSGGRIVSFQEEAPTLADLFLRITEEEPSP